ncbi:MAG: hypothetical protein WC321_06330 [Candidatus Omnitrophota bacterium]|jgi:Flp pilus assembly pilin Flp
MRLNQRGQNTLEYAVIIAAIVAALLLGQKYFKRGIQGKIREPATKSASSLSRARLPVLSKRPVSTRPQKK